jgi:hypothetical protein
MLMQVLMRANASSGICLFLQFCKKQDIDFIKPGRGTVTAKFVIDKEQIKDIILKTTHGQKYLPKFTVDIVDQANNKIAHVIKTLYIRKK